MTKKDTILAFLGKRSPLHLKVRKANASLIIDFGELKVPVGTNIFTRRLSEDEGKIRELEDKYDCRITLDGVYLSVLPRAILGFNVLASNDDETLRKLYEWFREKGVKLIKEEFII